MQQPLMGSWTRLPKCLTYGGDTASAASSLLLQLELLRVLQYIFLFIYTCVCTHKYRYIHICIYTYYILVLPVHSPMYSACLPTAREPSSRIAMWKIRLSSWRRGNAFTMVSLAQWLHHGAHFGLWKSFFLAKMDANSGYAKPWYPCQWGYENPIYPWVILIFFRKTVARQSFLTTHQIVNSRQADKQCQTHIEKHEMFAKYINLRWQPQSMGYKVDVALLLLTVEVLSAFVFPKIRELKMARGCKPR